MTEPAPATQATSRDAAEPKPDDVAAALDALLTQFDRAVRALGDAGQSDAACRLTAAAWSATRHVSRRADRRLTATLHYLVLPATTTNDQGTPQ